MIILAFDIGVKTGYAMYCTTKKQYIRSGECTIFEAYDMLKELNGEDEENDDLVIIEDARFVKYKTDPFKAQGAGWIKTLSGQFEKVCQKLHIKYKLVRPNKIYTKKDSLFVQKQTGVETAKGREHERDAILLLHFYGLK